MVSRTIAEGEGAESGGRSMRRQLSARISSLSLQDQGALIDGSSAALSEGQLPANGAFLASLALLELPAEPPQLRPGRNDRAELGSADQGSDQDHISSDVTNEKVGAATLSLPGAWPAEFLSIDTRAAEEFAALASRR